MFSVTQASRIPLAVPFPGPGAVGGQCFGHNMYEGGRSWAAAGRLRLGPVGDERSSAMADQVGTDFRSGAQPDDGALSQPTEGSAVAGSGSGEAVYPPPFH